jgi:aspartyl-tRNA synthetase
MHRYRSHTCGALRESDIGQTVRLSGWCHRIRDHGGVLFIDLRDHYGLTQCVVDPDSPAFKDAERLRSEWVVRVDGKVRRRPEGTANPELPTGEVELYVSEIEVLGPAGELPLPVFGEQEYPEDIRLKYRFLDLRREKLHQNIMTRGAIVDAMRKRMKDQGFFEFPDPDPDGVLAGGRARLPGAVADPPGQVLRLAPGAAAVQAAPDDVGLRPLFPDRALFPRRGPARRPVAGEFYQLDVEMSFVTQDDVFAAMEPVITGVFEGLCKRQVGDEKLATDSVRGSLSQVRHRQAGLCAIRSSCKDVSSISAAPASRCSRGCLRTRRTRSGRSRAGRRLTRVLRPNEFLGPGRGPARARLHHVARGGEGAGPLANNIGPERTATIRDAVGLKEGDAAFFVAGDPTSSGNFPASHAPGLARS